MISGGVEFWKGWDIKKLNHEFTPINFIGDKNKRETYQSHVEFSQRETQKARNTIPCQLDIPYGESKFEKIDIFGTDLPANAPSFLWIHGGYWRAGNRSWSGHFVSTLYSWGFRPIVIDYPLAPKFRMLEMCRGICDAITKAMNSFPESPFFIGAHSAGAQLLSTLLYQVPNLKSLSESHINRIKGLIFISGTYDMRPAMLMPKVNDDLQLTEHDAPHFSAVLMMDRIHSEWKKHSNNLKILIIYGRQEPPALQYLGEIYADMLRKKSFWTEYWVDQDCDHFSIIDTMANPESPINKKLKRFLLRESLNLQVKL